MNRRKLLGLFATAPVAIAAASLPVVAAGARPMRFAPVGAYGGTFVITGEAGAEAILPTSLARHPLGGGRYAGVRFHPNLDCAEVAGFRGLPVTAAVQRPGH